MMDLGSSIYSAPSRLEGSPSEVDASSKIFRIGELAKLTGSTTRTLRFYEELELLEPLRNSSGQRLYDERAVQRLHFISELKSGGFSLLEIKNFFDSWRDPKSGAMAAEASMEMIQRKLAEIADLQEKLSHLNRELRGMVTFLMSCRGCEHKPAITTCGVCDRHPAETLNPLVMKLVNREPQNTPNPS